MQPSSRRVGATSARSSASSEASCPSRARKITVSVTAALEMLRVLLGRRIFPRRLLPRFGITRNSTAIIVKARRCVTRLVALASLPARWSKELVAPASLLASAFHHAVPPRYQLNSSLWTRKTKASRLGVPSTDSLPCTESPYVTVLRPESDGHNIPAARTRPAGEESC